jgi:hypothetical protein
VKPKIKPLASMDYPYHLDDAGIVDLHPTQKDEKRMKNKYRFSLMIDESRKQIFIAVDMDFISEVIFKFKNKWEGGMCLAIGNKYTEIAKFGEWVKGVKKGFEIKSENGFSKRFTPQEVKVMLAAVCERDKRLKMENYL